MLDHVSVAVRDLKTSAAGLRRIVERPGMTPLPPGPGIHIWLGVPDEAAVRAFHAEAIKARRTDSAASGPRQAAMTRYYAAFVQDPDSNKLEAATFPRKA